MEGTFSLPNASRLATPRAAAPAPPQVQVGLGLGLAPGATLAASSADGRGFRD